jgi:hypothetical protein
MYVVWGQVHPIMEWFAINASPWQHLDQFEKKSSIKVVKSLKFLFLNTKKCCICQTMSITLVGSNVK